MTVTIANRVAEVIDAHRDRDHWGAVWEWDAVIDAETGEELDVAERDVFEALESGRDQGWDI